MNLKLRYRPPRLVTPRVVVGAFPKLNSPSTRFDKAGVYELKVGFLDSDSLQEMTRTLEPIYEEVRKELPDDKVLIENAIMHDDEGSPFMRFRLKAKIITDQGLLERKPKIYDATNKPTDRMVGQGSEVQVAFDPFFYADSDEPSQVKVSCRLYAVRVLKLVEGTPVDPETLFGLPDESGFAETEETADIPF